MIANDLLLYSFIRAFFKKIGDCLAERIITLGSGIEELALGVMGKLEVFAKICEKSLETGFPELRGLVLFYKCDVVQTELFKVD